MSQLFETRPVRGRARHEPWPPTGRDPADVALVAARILIIGGRLRSRLHRAARRVGVEPDLVSLLLLFSESNRMLLISDVAEQLGVGRATASRLATRAEAAGLIDKLTSSVDGREVRCRLSVAGRTATTRCLGVLRPHAIAVLHRADREWVVAAQTLLQPSVRFDRRTGNFGWRAGVRAGMPAGE
jgi:DNA-binding MarR family transcriptional regulator